MRMIRFLRMAGVAALLAGGAAAETPSWAREIVHYKVLPNGSELKTGSTETISDPSKNMYTQITRNERGVEIARREFILDSKGRIRRGAIWDGSRKLLARTEYGFDAYDRINEERTFHPSGLLLRRLLFKYDATGRRLPDKFFVINRNNPRGPMIESRPTAEEASPILPVQKGDRDLPGMGLPQFRGSGTQVAAPAAIGAPAAAPAKAEKPGILQKLFGRDKKP